MQGKHWLVVVSVLVLAAFGCRERNPHHCFEGEMCPLDARQDQCGNIKCMAPTPVCETVTETCVECVVNTDCAPTQPVCSLANVCTQCQVDDDCDSKLCLLGGACADAADVTYVGGMDPTNNATCPIDRPCENLEQALTPTALRKYIKVTGSVATPAVTVIDNKRVTIYGGAGAQLSRSMKDEVLSIKGTSEVTLVNLEILGNTGAAAGKECVTIEGTSTVTMTRVNQHGHGQVGILMTGGKLVLTDTSVHDNAMDGLKITGGVVEIRRSSIYGNKGTAGVLTTTTGMVTIDSSVIAANSGSSGGVSITGPFSIRNSIIVGNGNVTSTTSAGGLTLNPLNAANAKFEFNTVADNVSSSTTTGLSCSNVSFDVSNSIFTGNTVNGCNVSYSLFTVSPGGTNKTGDAMFVSRTLLAPMFYRIGMLSGARDSADPAAVLDVDIDGQVRSDGRKDMGADEYK